MPTIWGVNFLGGGVETLEKQGRNFAGGGQADSQIARKPVHERHLGP